MSQRKQICLTGTNNNDRNSKNKSFNLCFRFHGDPCSICYNRASKAITATCQQHGIAAFFLLTARNNSTEKPAASYFQAFGHWLRCCNWRVGPGRRAVCGIQKIKTKSTLPALGTEHYIWYALHGFISHWVSTETNTRAYELFFHRGGEHTF